MRPGENRYHLEQVDEKTWKLYHISPSGERGKAIVLHAKTSEKKPEQSNEGTR
jgi:hypothetical protein